jgi:hypothetical protein
MAKRLPVDREAIKSTYLATGSFEETASLHKMNAATIRKWSQRFQWPSPHNAIKMIEQGRDILAEHKEKNDTRGVTISTSEALEEHLATSTKVFKTGMATALQRIGETAGSMDGLTALEHSRKLKDASDVAKTILGIGQDNTGASLQVNLLTLSLDNIIKPVQAIEI